VYAGAARGRRAAVSIGTNPHFDGVERRVEAHLLDFDDDLYGQRLVVEIWSRLRGQRRFESLEALVAAIDEDVEQTRSTVRPG
jgi:riboflavin kinase/FMN adenylyltransferase